MIRSSPLMSRYLTARHSGPVPIHANFVLPFLDGVFRLALRALPALQKTSHLS